MPKLTREALEQSARKIAGELDQALAAVHGQRVGFTLFLFGFGAHENIAYISNSQRADMIRTVEEWLARQKAGLATDPPGPRAES